MESEKLKSEKLKSIVKQVYSEIADKSEEELCTSSCCGTHCGDREEEFTYFNDDYSNMKGYNKDADLRLGCGMPTEIAAIKLRDTVLDLGSGAGNDVFVARELVGDSGRVIGVDMTEAMIAKANLNLSKLGYKNIEFRLGEIEQLPVEDSLVDVVVSNCVLNLVPNKQKAFAEIYRVLKIGGHFSISDIVINRHLPPSILEAAQMYAGCVSGASFKDEYLGIIKNLGFKNIQVKIEKPIILPKSVLEKYLEASEVTEFLEAGPAILSITVYGEK